MCCFSYQSLLLLLSFLIRYRLQKGSPLFWIPFTPFQASVSFQLESDRKTTVMSASISATLIAWAEEKVCLTPLLGPGVIILLSTGNAGGVTKASWAEVSVHGGPSWNKMLSELIPLSFTRWGLDSILIDTSLLSEWSCLLLLKRERQRQKRITVFLPVLTFTLGALNHEHHFTEDFVHQQR